MSKFQLVFFILFVSYFVNICQASVKQRQNYRIKTGKHRRTKKLPRRKLEDMNPQGNNNLTFVNLSIYLDTDEFNHTIPPSLNEYHGVFIKSMLKAQEILQDFLEILIDLEGKPRLNRTYINEEWGIIHYTYNFEEIIDMKKYNYFIFAKFVDLPTDDCVSIILDEFTGVPLANHSI